MQTQLHDLFNTWLPDTVVIENILYIKQRSKDATLWLVGTFVLAMLAAITFNANLVSVFPGTLKKSVAGNGKANKALMVRAVNEALGTKLQASEHNKADALALGVHHLKNQK